MSLPNERNLARTQSESSIFMPLSNYVNSQVTITAVPEGHADHAIATCPLILTLGHIRVRTFFFHVLAACSTVSRFQSQYPPGRRVHRRRNPAGRVYYIQSQLDAADSTAQL